MSEQNPDAGAASAADETKPDDTTQKPNGDISGADEDGKKSQKAQSSADGAGQEKQKSTKRNNQSKQSESKMPQNLMVTLAALALILLALKHREKLTVLASRLGEKVSSGAAQLS